MSLCPTLAAGFSRFTQRPVIAVEGDGNALMGLSGLPVVSRAARGPFVHIVLDNGLYESTGGQQTLSSLIDFSQVASGTGYESFHRPEDLSSLESLLEGALQEEKRTYFHIRTWVKDSIAYPRVPYDPRQITQRFREAVSFSSEA